MKRDCAITLRKYIGRSYEQYNCFDLVREFYEDNFGLEIKNYWEGPAPERKQVASLIITNKGDFVKVEDAPKYGDIMIIRLYGVECHVGVYIENGRFLHSARNIGSIIDRVERYNKMIAGYYRHRERA